MYRNSTVLGLVVLFAVVSLLGAVAPAGAETVMVAVAEQGNGTEGKQTARYYLSAVEAGALDVLFEEGHIAFNAGTYDIEERSTIAKRYEIRRIARDGGAGFALYIEMQFARPEPETVSPTQARYQLLDIERSAILREGEFDVEQEPDEAVELACFRVGSDIADEILGVW